MSAPKPPGPLCPYCEQAMQTQEMSCIRCGVAVRAKFPSLPLANLPVEHQRFIEMFVLASGNLKEIATLAGVSYPTVRSRLDRVIESLRAAMQASVVKSLLDPEESAPEANPLADDPASIIKRI